MDANGKFAVTVVENYHEGDLVWIQDFHLLLVPNLLARRHIAPTALFLHVPFPSSEIFRSLSVRDELLRGMLSADHIGFHLFEYARHFLTSCRRILGLTHSVRRGGLLAIEYQGREVLITVSHVGIEPSHLLSTFRASPTPILNAAGWRKRYSGAKIVGGIDSVERLKGVPLKLRAWELYLNTHPEEVGSAVMVQICIEDTVRPGDKQEESKQEILSLAERINARYSKQVPAHRTSAHGGADGQTVLLPAVHVEIRATPVPLQERLALWLATDVLVNTSIRDGLSLFPLEYTYVRGAEDCMLGARDAAAVKASNPEHPQAEFAAAALAACDGDLALLNPGILVLSEFTGGSRVLFGAIKVNPWRTNEVATAIAHALTVSQEEAFARAESNLQYVRGNTTAAWAERVLVDLKGAGKKGGAGRTYMGYGLGLGYRLMGFGASFRPLNTEHVLTAYRRSGHRLFVFDYGGTLNVRDSGETRQKAFESGLLHGKDAAPPLTAETKKALRILSEDPRNTVFIVSGKEKEVLAQAFASLPHVGLAAEHGFYFRWGAPRPAKAGSGAAQASKVGAVPKAGSGGPSGVNGELSTTLQPASDSFASPALGAAAASSRDSIEQPGSLVLGGGALGDNGQPWETCVPVLSSMDEWKGLACTIMEMYAARTNGTFILRKGSAVSWHYSDADPEFGSMQAKELQDHLTGVLAGYPVDVLSGHGYVEVRPKGVNKGAVLEIIMNKLEGKESSNSGPNTPSAAGVPPSPMVRASSGPSPSTSGNGSGVGMGGVLTGPGSVDRASPVPLAGAGAAMTPSSSLNNLRRTSSGFGRSFTGRPLEFILCVGDDQADEEMFTTVQRVRTIRLSEHRAALSKLSSTAAPAPAVAPPGAAGAPASVVADEPEPARTSKVAGPAGLQITEEGSADAAAATASGASPSGPLSGGSSAGGTLPAAMKSSALNPLSYTYYEYTVTVGKKPSAAQYFLDDTGTYCPCSPVLFAYRRRHTALAPPRADPPYATALTSPSPLSLSHPSLLVHAGQTEDVLRSIARVAAKELSGSNKVRTGSSLASGPLPVAGGGSGTAGAFPTTATQAPAAASSHTAGVSVQAALGTAARTGASLVRAGASGGLLSLPAGLHALAAGGHGGSGMGGIGLPGGRGPGARGMQPSQPAAAAATPVFFSSNALAALEAAATSVAYGGGGSGAGPGGAALQGAFSPGTAFFGAGTTGDLSSYWANFAGSTTNIAGLNTNIPLLDGTVFSRSSYSQVDAGGSGAGPSSSGGGATAGTASGGATAGLAISTSTPGRALGQLPGLLPGASVLNLASAGYGHGAHGSGSGGYGGSATASGSPQGSGSKLGAEAQGGVARTAAVNAGNPYAMAGLLAFSGGSTTRLSSSGAVAGHHLGRVAEGPEGGEVDEHGHASESDAEDGYSENEGEGGMGGHPSGSKRRLAAGASPGGVAGQRQSMGFSSGLGLGGPLQGPLTGGIGTSHVLPGGTDPAQAGMQGGVPQAGVGGHGLGPYCGGILQVQEEETLEF